MNPDPSPETRFQPGVSGNPRGRPRKIVPPEELHRYPRREFAEIVNRILEASMDECGRLFCDPEKPVIERFFAHQMLNGGAAGVIKKIQPLIDAFEEAEFQWVEAKFVRRDGYADRVPPRIKFYPAAGPLPAQTDPGPGKP